MREKTKGARWLKNKDKLLLALITTIIFALQFSILSKINADQTTSSNQETAVSNNDQANSALYKRGDVVRISQTALTQTNGVSLESHRGLNGTIMSVFQNPDTNFQWEYSIIYPNGAFDEHVAEKDITNISPARYKIGDTVKISGNASIETNGYSLVNRQNWNGTVVSVTPKAFSNSAWEYDIVYPNGQHNVHVAEQDVTNISPARYKVGDTIKIAGNAWAETNGYSLVNHQNWVGTITSVTPKAFSNSAWEYDIVYPNGQHNVHVAEQDITDISPARYKVGDTIKIAGNAWAETNGYSLVNHQNWNGTVVSVTPKAFSNSAWEYDIVYPNGQHNVHVAEQDVTNISPARYKVGDTIKIAGNAWAETNGYSLVNHQNWVGTITSVTPKAFSNSAWEYYVTYSNGQHNDHVAEQDIVPNTTSYPHPQAGGTNSYPKGYCTYGVKEMAPWVGNYWGDASNWANAAKKAGYVVNSTPEVGSVVVFQNGQGGANSVAGHVAFVIGVNGNTITVKEMNFQYGSGGFNIYSTRNIVNASSYQYIH
ncbi:CHAP domain-containing protein [Leuconostoc pseudomesenteroides]|uniref:CHAP domain-containing protein n=1 Tax=Leuconostoc pseudomesenteroides TaxID=33968 RepID=UPI0032DF7F8B